MFINYKKLVNQQAELIKEQNLLIKIQDDQYQDISNELYRVKRAYQNLEDKYTKLLEENEKNLKKIKEFKEKKKAKKNE